MQEDKFGCFITMSVHKNYFTTENMGQILFKKHLKFQNFNEISYWGMTRFRNAKLKNTISKQKIYSKNMEQDRFRKLSKFQKFQFSNFTLPWSNQGKRTYPKELHRKMKILDKIGQRHLNLTISMKYCGIALSRNSNHVLMSIESSLSQKIMKFIKFFPYNIHSEQNKTNKNKRFDETKDSCSNIAANFS